MRSVADWLNAFARGLAQGNPGAVGDLFEEGGFWRDYLPFGGTLQTIEGRAAIESFAAQTAAATAFRDARVEDGSQADEGFFGFTTAQGTGRGHIRLRDGLCHTLFTMLEDRHTAPPQAPSNDPDVLIVGGGQCGLALGAQLADLGVSYLIVDTWPRVGDQWRSRYDSLVLHDPVWYDHMPFVPFPEDWPVFTPKDQMGDWLEGYAQKLSLSIWTKTELTRAAFDPAQGCWDAHLLRDGAPQTLRPRHLVFALGISGFPKRPTFAGTEAFEGPQLHSSAYKGGTEYAGKDVIVIGANNSAHDIAADLIARGARPTMIQRSSTLVVRQDDYCERLLGPLYSAEAVARGITTDKADILQAATPLRLLEPRHRAIWDQIQADQAAYYDGLRQSGFTLDFAEDGAGLAMKYRRTASGYYIDVGAAQMVCDGRIAIRSGTTVREMQPRSVVLTSAEELPADAVIYATGYGTMTDWVGALIDEETAQKVGPCWGYGSGTRGDPGPWVGELRNMWVETAQEGLWFMGGNLSQARFFSRLLALQLAR